jgi:hypothetical protein
VGSSINKQVRLGHPDAGEHGQPLPAAGQGSERRGTVLFGDRQVIQHDIGTPALSLGLIGGQGGQDGVAQGQGAEGAGDILRQMADAQAPGAGDLACGGLVRAGQAAEQGGLAPAIGGDKADAVGAADGQVKAGEQRYAKGNAKGAKGENAHGSYL